MVAKTQQDEVDQNYEAFKAMLPDLLKTNENKFALMHNREILACFDTSQDAIKAGHTLLEGKRFSVQEVTCKSVDLGYFSHARILRMV